MLKPMCQISKWLNAEVPSCHHAPPDTPWTRVVVPSGLPKSVVCGSSASRSTRVEPLPPAARIASQTAALSAIRPIEVSAGLAEGFPPYGSTPERVDLAPSRTQLGHWNPTDAEFMQSGQIGRSHRWQRTQVSLPGCRSQPGVAATPPASGSLTALVADDLDRLDDHGVDRPVARAGRG